VSGEEPAVNAETVASLKEHLRLHYGPFWRRRVRVLLVIGESRQVEAAVPGLAEQQWLEAQGAVLLWGGGAQAGLSERAAHWQRLSRRRFLDGVVWVLGEGQQTDDVAMASGVGHLLMLTHRVKWQLPLHLLQVCGSEWWQSEHQRLPVGCRFMAPCTLGSVEEQLKALVPPLRQRGLRQMCERMSDDFLLRLSADLHAGDAERWQQTLTPLLKRLDRGAPLRGLWFSLPMGRSEATGHVWAKDAAWGGILENWRKGGRIGWPVTRVGYAAFLVVATLWGAGMLLSYANNRAELTQVQASLAALQSDEHPDAQLIALSGLTRHMQRLDERARRGEPWHLMFGLSQSAALLDLLWPRYAEAHHRLLRNPTAVQLRQALHALINLPPDSPHRARGAHDAYLQLKAYLMLARPDKAEAQFLAETLADQVPMADDRTPAVWRELSLTLWPFYAAQLAVHPEWRLEPDQALITQVRHALTRQLKRRNDEVSLYRTMLDAAALQYEDLHLEDLVGQTDSNRLFSGEVSVPGVFTRQAWEGQVRQVIDDIAAARRERMDWVLAEHPKQIDEGLTADALRQRLTQRYFQDYASAWVRFLDHLRWREAESLNQVVDQLTLISDPRQSPLIALLKNLVWQGQAGSFPSGSDSTDSQAAQPGIEPSPTPIAPLEPTFGPLFALMGTAPDGQLADRVSLRDFLNQVTRLRVKVRQANSAADPQRMTQAMVQAVFQGRAADLTDTRAYGELIVANLGADWQSGGQTLFVEPLEQAWRQLLQPSAASLNRQWREGIVDQWNDAFAGRYPFVTTGSDASLAMLGQFIRADSGRIEQFLQRQLGGVLRKEGSRWGVDTQLTPGVRFNPDFLAAINQLSQLSDVLYSAGGLGVGFELQGKPARNVVQTTLTLNGIRHRYFNQKERWQRFVWPGSYDHPGASLSWTSVHSGERLYGDFQGTWGLIRLLDDAHITSLDDASSRYRVVIKAPDGVDLTWFLRGELGAGPLSLLTLRDFRLPKQIFLSEDDTRQPAVQREIDS
jgi:type VI secretion system protein ImpL